MSIAKKTGKAMKYSLINITNDNIDTSVYTGVQ